MPEVKKVIADTSILIAFEKLGLLDLLCSTYETIVLPPAVHREYSSTSLSCFIVAEAPPGLSDFLEAQAGLGRGEAEAIAMAHLSGTTILIDDLKARKVAKKLGCRISGTVGVLCRMERQGMIDSAYEKISRLKDLGFRVSNRLIDKLKT